MDKEEANLEEIQGKKVVIQKNPRKWLINKTIKTKVTPQYKSREDALLSLGFPNPADNTHAV